MKGFPVQGNAQMNDDNQLVVDSASANATIIGKEGGVTIGGGAADDTKLVGIVITKALTGTLVITGFEDSDGTATNFTFPAATAAGAINFGGIVNSAGALTVTYTNVSDRDNVIVQWIAV